MAIIYHPRNFSSNRSLGAQKPIKSTRIRPPRTPYGTGACRRGSNRFVIRVPDDLIDLESNLNSRVLKKTIKTLDLDYSPFQLKEKLIDERLLKLRNEIAHGAQVSINETDFEIIEADIRNLIEVYQ